MAALEYGSVNFVIAVLIWFMVYPILYVVIPLSAGVLTRLYMTRSAETTEPAEAAVAAFTGKIKTLSVLGLLMTVVLLFGFQGEVMRRSSPSWVYWWKYRSCSRWSGLPTKHATGSLLKKRQ